MKTSKINISFILCGTLQFLLFMVNRSEAQITVTCPGNSLEADECFLRSKMHRIAYGECREKCAIVTPVAKLFGWQCGKCGSNISPPISSPITAAAPIRIPIKAPSVPQPVLRPSTMSTGTKKCGGAVNTGGGSANVTCLIDLWNPTQDRTMHCYAYGGVTDPCALHNNNDINDSLFKSPAKCDRDTFYLWDEVRVDY